MYAQLEKSKENKSRAVANSVAQKKSSVSQDFGFVDNRPEIRHQQNLQMMMQNDTRRVLQHETLQDVAGQSQLQEPINPILQLKKWTKNIANKGVIQQRQHGNLTISNFLQQHAQNNGEERGAYVGRVTTLFKQQNPQHDKDDIDELRRRAWGARFPTRPHPAVIAIPLAGGFNNHILGNQAGVGWHSESVRQNGNVGWSYANRQDLASSKGTYFADTVVINNTPKAGNNGRSTFFPQNMGIAHIRTEAEYVANTFPQQGQIRRGRGRQTGIVIDCLINNNTVESAYPYKPGW